MQLLCEVNVCMLVEQNSKRELPASRRWIWESALLTKCVLLRTVGCFLIKSEHMLQMPFCLGAKASCS